MNHEGARADTHTHSVWWQVCDGTVGIDSHRSWRGANSHKDDDAKRHANICFCLWLVQDTADCLRLLDRTSKGTNLSQCTKRGSRLQAPRQ